MKKRIIDKRKKEKFMIDDGYLNGQAKYCGWQATLVYVCLCRHADKYQECFPSIKLMSEKLKVSRPTIQKGLKNLVRNNVIQIVKEKNKKQQWLNNRYILIDKSEWRKHQLADKNRRKKTKRGSDGRFSKTQVNNTDTDSHDHSNSNPCPQECKPITTTRSLRKHIEGNKLKETHTVKNFSNFSPPHLSLKEKKKCSAVPPGEIIDKEQSGVEVTKEEREDYFKYNRKEARRVAKEEGWTPEQYIRHATESSDLPVKIIGEYLLYKKFKFENIDELDEEFSRNIKVANKLKCVSMRKIKYTFKRLDRLEYLEKGWTLETVFKKKHEFDPDKLTYNL